MKIDFYDFQQHQKTVGCDRCIKFVTLTRWRCSLFCVLYIICDECFELCGKQGNVGAHEINAKYKRQAHVYKLYKWQSNHATHLLLIDCAIVEGEPIKHQN